MITTSGVFASLIDFSVGCTPYDSPQIQHKVLFHSACFSSKNAIEKVYAASFGNEMGGSAGAQAAEEYKEMTVTFKKYLEHHFGPSPEVFKEVEASFAPVLALKKKTKPAKGTSLADAVLKELSPLSTRQGKMKKLGSSCPSLL